MGTINPNRTDHSTPRQSFGAGRWYRDLFYILISPLPDTELDQKKPLGKICWYPLRRAQTTCQHCVPQATPLHTLPGSSPTASAAGAQDLLRSPRRRRPTPCGALEQVGLGFPGFSSPSAQQKWKAVGWGLTSSSFLLSLAAAL